MDDGHATRVADQFTRQAELFAASPELHGDAVLALLVEAAAPRPADEALDVACGPGTVVAAFAPRVRRAVGLDATAAMLEEARKLEARRGLSNVEWRSGDVYRLPFGDASFDVVSCRFAFHHLERPQEAFEEMLRVCRPGGRIVLCDGVAPDDAARAAAFNRMERLRDPSTVEFRPLAALRSHFERSALPAPAERFFRVRAERDALAAMSFPAGGDRELLRRIIDESVEGDALGMNARRRRDTVVLDYASVVLAAEKPARPPGAARPARASP